MSGGILTSLRLFECTVSDHARHLLHVVSFFPSLSRAGAELSELFEQEEWAYEVANNPQAYEEELEAELGSKASAEAKAEMRERLEALATPLTEEEMARKDALYQDGFLEWTRKEYQAFTRGCTKVGF